MKHRKIKCLTKIHITDDIKSCYRWRVSNQSTVGFYLEARQHRVPFFLSLHAHLIIEQTLETILNKLELQPFSKITLLFYDIIHGLVSSHSMKEISSFWLKR